MEKLSDKKIWQLKESALNKIAGWSEWRIQKLIARVTKWSEKKILNQALEKINWYKTNEKIHDYQIFLAVECVAPWFWEKLVKTTDNMEWVAGIIPLNLMDESLKEVYPHIVKNINLFLQNDDIGDNEIEELFQTCIKPFQQQSEEFKKDQEASDVADRRRTRSILETFLTKTRSEDDGWIPYILYNLNEFWLDTEWGIRVIAKEYWYSSEQIDTIIQNCNEFKKEVEVKTYRRNHSKEWRTFDKLLKGETWRRTDEVMSDPDRKEKAKSCGCSEQDISTIETNYQKSK